MGAWWVGSMKNGEAVVNLLFVCLGRANLSDTLEMK